LATRRKLVSPVLAGALLSAAAVADPIPEPQPIPTEEELAPKPKRTRKKAAPPEVAVFEGSGNVFADLGLSNPEERLAQAETRLAEPLPELMHALEVLKNPPARRYGKGITIPNHKGPKMRKPKRKVGSHASHRKKKSRR
jgi:hypothetical protein